MLDFTHGYSQELTSTLALILRRYLCSWVSEDAVGLGEFVEETGCARNKQQTSNTGSVSTDTVPHSRDMYYLTCGGVVWVLIRVVFQSLLPICTCDLL